MRSHGVPDFPDPSTSSGTHISPSAGFNPQSPAFQSAMQTCKHLLPVGGAPPESATQHTAELKFAECMRAHGVPNYPDPTIPTSNGLRAQPTLPSSISRDSPAFQQAQAACAYTGGG